MLHFIAQDKLLFLHLIHQATKAPNKTQFMTSIKLPHVSAPGCHPQCSVARSHDVCCLYGCFVYNIISYSFGSVLYHCIYGCMFCTLLFNSVNYLLLLCILIVMYVLFLCILFQCAVLCTVVCKCVLYCCQRVSTQS